MIYKSGREDLNLRPPAPKAGALARLSYAPIMPKYCENEMTLFMIHIS